MKFKSQEEPIFNYLIVFEVNIMPHKATHRIVDIPEPYSLTWGGFGNRKT